MLLLVVGLLADLVVGLPVGAWRGAAAVPARCVDAAPVFGLADDAAAFKRSAAARFDRRAAGAALGLLVPAVRDLATVFDVGPLVADVLLADVLVDPAGFGAALAVAPFEEVRAAAVPADFVAAALVLVKAALAAAVFAAGLGAAPLAGARRAPVVF